MSGGDRLGRGRGAEEAQQSAEQEAADQERVQHMRLLGMRRRQVQRKAQRAAANPAAAIPQTTGAPLGKDVQRRMEGQLGSDLSAVRVHTGSESQTAAAGFGAHAFTVGTDVHFGAGQFAPGSKEGDKLLAHELTHVVQGQHAGVQRKADADHDGGEAGEATQGDGVSQPHEPAEQEADAVSEHVAGALHGDAKAAGGQAPKEAKPKVAAKLNPSRPLIHRSPNGAVSDAKLGEKAGPGGLKETGVKSFDGKSDKALVNVGGKSMAQNPDFEKDAMSFEDKLGAKAWGHPIAQAGAADMAKKAKLSRAGGSRRSAAVSGAAAICASKAG